uniref:phosphatidate phosphatase n=1 Tax=Cyanoderma ruficeps TaxID=181631 RepID=A0A8C3R0K5_9PASS
MNYVGQLAESVLGTMKELYQDLNSATLSGCIDVVVVRQPDNSFKCSPFHVRFGKLGVLRSREKVVDIEINGEPVDLHMKLGDNGEAFFVEESEDIPSYLCTSPICKERSSNYTFQPSYGLEVTSTGAILRKRRRRKRRPKKKLVLDLNSDSNDESESEMTIKEPRELPVKPHITFSSCSFMPTSKSDSELEIKPQESFALGAESHLKWIWGKLPQVSVNVVPEVQADEEPFEGATAPRQAGSEGPESQLERRRRQGEGVTESIKSPRLGPRAIYVEDLSKLDSKPVALYFQQSLRPVTDPSSPPCIQLPSTLPANSPVGSDSMPTVALSLCGGLRGSRQISHEKFMEHMVSYQQFAENPRLLSDPNLVIMINKEYYNWAVAGPIVLALQAFQRNIPEVKLVKEKMPKRDRRCWFSWRRREFPTEGEKESLSDNQLLHPGDMLAVEASAQKPLPTYKKSLRLSSKQIGRLNLQDGPNEVAFSVTTQYQGTCRCEATIYLWNWNEKVVISDIDGTITKSDALGHILPQLGKDWTHRGIVKLFHKIHLNGYKFLYCSARAIGMADITKGYLKWVNEQGCGLPMGPMLLSPSSLLSAFHREVIEKKPEVSHPMLAFLGQDVYAYKQVGLPESRIFTVNPKGELIQELTKDQKSTYERLLELVEVFFPPVGQRRSSALAFPDYSHFAYTTA